jgi:outer membrane protein TolC
MTAIGIAAALLLAQPAPAPEAPTLTYEAAVKEALARNLDLEATRALVDQARTIGWKAWSSQLPQVGATGTYTHASVESKLSVPSQYQVIDVGTPGAPNLVTGQPIAFADQVIQKQDQLGATVQATLPLVAPQLWFGIAAAGEGEKQAIHSLEAARREILFGVAQVYYGAVGVKYVVQITGRQLDIARDHEKDARVRYQAGTTPKVAFLRAEIDRARAEQDLRAAQAGYDSARVALATLLARPGIDFEVEVPAEPAVPAQDEELLAATRDRPEVRAAEAALRSAEHQRRAAWSGYLPNLGAFYRWQWASVEGFSGTKDSWAAGLQLSWNLFDGTLREALIKESAARVAAADASRRSAEAKAREEVLRARLELEAALANREKAKEQVEFARENQKLIEVNFKAGAATYIEVSDANNQLLTAEVSVVAEQVRSRLAALRLLKAAGRFDPR